MDKKTRDIDKKTRDRDEQYGKNMEVAGGGGRQEIAKIGVPGARLCLGVGVTGRRGSKYHVPPQA